MAPSRITRRRWRVSLLATAFTTTALMTTGAGAAPVSAPTEGCSMPDCHAAIALNTETGFFVNVKNFPSEQAARREAITTCRDQDASDRHCTVLRVVDGDRCVGAAMTVEDGAIVEHATAVRNGHQSALDAAEGRLEGPEPQRHRISGVCNG